MAAESQLTPKNRVLTEPDATRVAVMTVNPYLLHVYWQISQQDLQDIRQALRESSTGARPVLRFYDITSLLFDGTNAHHTFDVEVDLRTTKWKVPIWSADKSYVVDLGYRGPEGRYYPVARSNVVNVPRADPPPRSAQGHLPAEEAGNEKPASPQVVHVALGKPFAATRQHALHRMEETLTGNKRPKPPRTCGSRPAEKEPLEMPQTSKAEDSAEGRSDILTAATGAGPAHVGDVDLVDFTLERFAFNGSSPIQWTDS